MLKHALRAQIPDIAAIWTDAFAADPYFRWIQPDDALWPAFGTDWMTFIAELCFERGHTYLEDDHTVAVAWIPPDIAFIDADGIAYARSIIAKHSSEERADQALAAVIEARGNVIEETHWTLQYIGVAARAQGTGAGRRAVAPMLATIDDEQLPCALVSTNTRNVSFYESLGFSVDAEVVVDGGAAVMRPMHRIPTGAA